MTNQCSLFCLSWCSIGYSPVSLWMSGFQRLCQRVTPTMSRRYIIWEVVNFPMSFLVTGLVSAPYNRTNITRVWNTHILVALLRFWLRKTSLLHIWYIVPAFLIFMVISLSTFPDCSTVLPRYSSSHLPMHSPEGDGCLICFQVVSSFECLAFSTLTACFIQYNQHVVEFTPCFCSQCQVISIQYVYCG